MRKYFVGLLLFLVLLLPVEITTYAADEELTFNEYVDEIAGMEKPYWSFDFYPELSFEHKFLWFEWGQADIVAWNIDTVSYYFTMNNEHVGKALVGYNPSDMDITFDYVFISMDDEGLVSSSGASFTYSLEDIEFDNGYVEFNFPYADILAACEYYELGYETVISSVKVTISSRVLKTRGTSMYYVFSFDRNFAKQIYTGIKFYERTNTDWLLISDRADVVEVDDTGGAWEGNGTYSYHYVVVYPDSIQEVALDLNSVVSMILIDFPRAVWSVIEFFFEFIIMLPSYIHMVVPFLPEYIIAAIMFVVVFGIVWGIVAWIRKLKGD